MLRLVGCGFISCKTWHIVIIFFVGSFLNPFILNALLYYACMGLASCFVSCVSFIFWLPASVLSNIITFFLFLIHISILFYSCLVYLPISVVILLRTFALLLGLLFKLFQFVFQA
jgi:hypothetical protein